MASAFDDLLLFCTLRDSGGDNLPLFCALVATAGKAVFTRTIMQARRQPHLLARRPAGDPLGSLFLGRSDDRARINNRHVSAEPS